MNFLNGFLKKFGFVSEADDENETEPDDQEIADDEEEGEEEDEGDGQLGKRAQKRIGKLVKERNSANAEVKATARTLYPGKEVYQKDGTVWQSLSHKHPLHLVGDHGAKLPDFPHETDSHYRAFIRAVKGETKTTSPFSVAAPLSQLFCLGNVAQRVRRGFAFDPAKGAILGDEYAAYFLKGPAPRKGWEEYYKA